MSRLILLSPGPVTLSDRVRQALLSEDVCHREPDFAQLVLGLKSALVQLYGAAQTGFEAIILNGSGTCAVEAMISSLAPQEATTLVVGNGVYGERIADMLRIRGRPLVEISTGWTDPMDLERTEKALRDNPSISHVVVIHNETTTGRLNDIQALADLCERYEKWLMIDAVSSFGAEAINFEHPRLLAVASAGNKCLHGIVGVAFVVVRYAYMDSHPSQADSLYLNLFTYRDAQKRGFSPYTPPTHALFALKEALAELRTQGGWTARRDRYRQLSQCLRQSLAGLGVPLLLKETAYSSMISSFVIPQGWDYNDIHDRLREAGFVIYAGQGDLYRSIFRISTMGDISDRDLDRLIDVLSTMLHKGEG